MLDVGCGAGKFLQLVKEAHPTWTVFGVEPFADAATSAARIPGAEIRVGDLLSAHWPEDLFDAVCFWDVFEHLEQPREVIQEVRRILAPGGYVYFLIPNFDCVWSKLFRGDWWQLLFPQHCYHYTPGTLRMVCESAGLRVERISFPKTIVNVHWDLANWRASCREGAARPSAPVRALDVVRPLARWMDRARLLPSPRMYVAARRLS